MFSYLNLGNGRTIDAIVTEKLSRRGLNVRRIYEYNPLRQIRVSSIMTTPLTTVDASTDVGSVSKAMNSPEDLLSRRKRVAVVRDGRLVGVIDRQKVFEASARADASVPVGSICSSDFETIRADESGYQP